MGLTMATIMFVGGGYLLCCCPVLAIGGGVDDGEDLIPFGFAPCLPFLMTAPGIFYADPSDDFSAGATRVAYVLGVFLYTIATSVLWGQLMTGFAAAAGRTVERPDAEGSGALPRLT
jgi:hypothetical protein